MSRCPFCDTILPDAWVKQQGAALMGKTRGQTKARSSDSARTSAQIGWKKRKKAKKKK